MPNWCNNLLKVLGPENDIATFTKRAVGYAPWMTDKEKANEKPCQLNFHSLVPIPKEVVNGDEAGIEQWEKENWGCKWGASLGGARHEVVSVSAKTVPTIAAHSFDTPWGPPIPFLKTVSDKWPTLIFLLDYDEPNMQFKGIAQAKAGKTENYHIVYGEINDTSKEPVYAAMQSALQFCLPYMEDLANSSHNANERRAAQLMREAIATAERI
jgi:hypothetical protein